MSKTREIREELKKLVKDKQIMEEDMDEIASKLEKSGGLRGSLVDHQGYPRSDVDVHETLAMRSKVNCLQTDYKELKKKIEEKMYLMHAFAKEEGLVQEENKNSSKVDKKEEKHVVVENLNPFLIVNTVAPNSPADLAGMKPQDEILRFGDVNEAKMKSFGLKIVSDLTQSHQNQKIEILVKRGKMQVVLVLVPKVWEGKGLLGCHLLPINK